MQKQRNHIAGKPLTLYKETAVGVCQNTEMCALDLLITSFSWSSYAAAKLALSSIGSHPRPSAPVQGSVVGSGGMWIICSELTDSMERGVMGQLQCYSKSHALNPGGVIMAIQWREAGCQNAHRQKPCW